jgi:heat shock protein HslJ
MKKVILVIVLVVMISGLYFLTKKDSIEKIDQSIQQVNFYDREYNFAGQKITLKNGISEIEALHGSTSKIITRYFGNVAMGDIDGDGTADKAYLLTQETGGSGTFFYVTALLNKSDGFVTVQPLFIGDRIAPQTTEVKNGQVIVNYVQRKSGESFAVQPSIGKSLYLKLDPKLLQFGEVVQNFEGEADPNKMSLNMKTWNWIRTTYNNDTEIKPKTNKFTLKFDISKKTFSATTDCNSVGGNYALSDKRMNNVLEFKNIISTLMYCDGSQETDFVKMLENTSSYYFTSKGELILDLKFDSGSMIFR